MSAVFPLLYKYRWCIKKNKPTNKQTRRPALGFKHLCWNEGRSAKCRRLWPWPWPHSTQVLWWQQSNTDDSEVTAPSPLCVHTSSAIVGLCCILFFSNVSAEAESFRPKFRLLLCPLKKNQLWCEGGLKDENWECDLLNASWAKLHLLWTTQSCFLRLLNKKHLVLSKTRYNYKNRWCKHATWTATFHCSSGLATTHPYLCPLIYVGCKACDCFLWKGLIQWMCKYRFRVMVYASNNES